MAVTRGRLSTPMRRIKYSALIVEAAMLLGAYFAYALTKNIVHASPADFAFQNAWNLTALETSLRIFHEATLQRWFLDHASWVVYLSSWFYVLGYWPVIGPAALLLWWKERSVYLHLRTSAFIAFGLVLLIYAAFPVAPPRMLPGFADTLLGLPVRESSQGFMANVYAAMPSVHYGLALFVAIGMVRVGSPALRVAGFAYQGLMLFSVIITGNHFFLDIAGSLAVVVIALLAARALERFFAAGPSESVEPLRTPAEAQ